MTNVAQYSRLIGLALLVSFMVSCGRFEGRRARSGQEGLITTQTTATLNPEDYESDLRQIVRDQIASAAGNETRGRSNVIFKKPYFYKEYAVYPDGPNAYGLEFSQSESRTSPYTAEVTVHKVQFSTQLHRSRDEARNDTQFLRRTGTETRTYQWRNASWAQVATFYMAEKLEENVDGVWSPAREVASVTVAAEVGDKGWFGRTWDRVRFWK